MKENESRVSTGPDQTAKILIVDDIPANAEALSDILGVSGYQIVVAEDGESTLHQAEQVQPDLILLDVILPGMDGFETCRRLKTNEKTQDISVIFVTALDNPADIALGFEVGGVDYITRPLRYKEVLARINTHLTICNLQKELLTQNKQLQEKNIRQMWAQEALKESRERYRLLAEHSTDIISRLTAEGVYLYVSPACKTMLGYEIEEMVGRSLYDFVHPQDVATMKEAGGSALERPDVMVQTYRTRRKDDSYTWSETTTKLIRYPKTGKVLEIVAITRDVSERKEAQEALEQANLSLQASNEDLRIFSRTVAHDLKNPIGGILGLCDLWELKGIIPEELQEDVQKVRRMAGKMSDIIDSLLLLAGVRQAEINPEPLDMAGIVAAAQERLAPMVAEYEAMIELPHEWPVALGYAPWIEEVWANYLSNALKYGGQPPHIQLGATVQPGNMVQFWVTDNGPGLTPEEHAQLFTPFVRVTQRQVEGHGLGLSIVQHIAEKLGGRAGVESKNGEGCKFYFLLPKSNAGRT
jgi:PAS domain S-box-containing protein